MDETQVPPATGTGIGTTSLGRLQLRVSDDDGFEDVVVQRRWPDVASARTWCERTVLSASGGTAVLEIQVFVESWRHPKSWETTSNHPVAEELQLGYVGADGRVHWGEPHSMTPRAGARHLL